MEGAEATVGSYPKTSSHLKEDSIGVMHGDGVGTRCSYEAHAACGVAAFPLAKCGRQPIYTIGQKVQGSHTDTDTHTHTDGAVGALANA
eukprot:360675-Chlamydomonas_euryale.AAC.8